MEQKKYKVTIHWQAHGYYTREVWAESEDQAINLAKEEDDDDLQAQMGDYRITEEHVEEDE